MSTVENIQSNILQGDIPAWDEKKKFFRMQAWFRILIAAVVLLWLIPETRPEKILAH